VRVRVRVRVRAHGEWYVARRTLFDASAPNHWALQSAWRDALPRRVHTLYRRSRGSGSGDGLRTLGGGSHPVDLVHCPPPTADRSVHELGCRSEMGLARRVEANWAHKHRPSNTMRNWSLRRCRRAHPGQDPLTLPSPSCV
jgi:hypothetical protein